MGKFDAVKSILKKLGTKEAEEAPSLVEKVASKFEEPRGVLSETPSGAEISLASGKKIIGDSKESATKAYGALYGNEKQSSKIINEMAAEAGAKKERELESAYNKRQELKSESNPSGADDTAVISDNEGLGSKLAGADNYLRNKLLNSIAKKLGNKDATTSDSSENARRVVSALAEKAGIPEDSTLGNIAKTAAATAIEMAPLNPSDFVAGKVLKGASKFIGGAAKSAAVKNVLEKMASQAALKKIEDPILAQRAATTMEVLGTKATNTAKELLQKGAKPVSYTKIIKSR